MAEPYPIMDGELGRAFASTESAWPLSSEELDRDAELDDAIGAIALQLGHFWELLRLGDQPHWRLGRL